MTTTPDNPLGDDEMSTEGVDPTGVAGLPGPTTLGNNATLQPFNPFLDTPVEGVHWKKADAFGQPLSRFAYQTPRTYQFSVGVKF